MNSAIMTAVEEAIDKGLMTGTEEDILLLDPKPKDIILHKFPIAGKTITTIGVTTGTQDLEVFPDFLQGDPEFHPDHPVEIETDVYIADNQVILPENVLRKTHH